MGKAKTKSKQYDIAAPTAEQMGSGQFEVSDIVDKQANGRTLLLGKAYRRKPMIDTLTEQGLFTNAEYKALKHYRHHADMADRSILMDSLGKRVGGSGGSGCGPTVAMLNAMRVKDDCERAAGSLVDILRAVVVYDMSLSQWAMSRNGAIEDCEIKKGQRVCRLKPRQKALAIAKLEIQMAAKRVESELSS